MTICATVYKPREGGLDDILTYGKVRVAYHPSTQPGLQMFAQALLEAGYDGSETLVISGAGKEVSFPSLARVAEGATLPSPIVVISQATYDALLGLQADPNHWANVSKVTKGIIDQNELVDDDYKLTVRAEESMRAFLQQQARPKPEPVVSAPKPAVVRKETSATTENRISQCTYDALVGLKSRVRPSKFWAKLGPRTKGFLTKNGLVDSDFKPTALADEAMRVFVQSQA